MGAPAGDRGALLCPEGRDDLLGADRLAVWEQALEQDRLRLRRRPAPVGLDAHPLTLTSASPAASTRCPAISGAQHRACPRHEPKRLVPGKQFRNTPSRGPATVVLSGRRMTG